MHKLVLLPKLFFQEKSTLFASLFFFFSLYLTFFSSGYGFREVLPPLSFLFLALLYVKDYEHSTLASFESKPALFFFLAFLLEAVLFSTAPLDSFLHVARGGNKQFMVFFLALECARSRTLVRLLTWVLLLAAYLQGLACLHQWITGYDLIHGDTLLAGRLTGTMAWYWVGSYLVLTVIPAFALCTELHKKLGPGIGLFVSCALFLPIVFGIVFGGSRASFLTLFFALAVILLFFLRRLTLRTRLLLAATVTISLLLVIFIFGQGRFSAEGMLSDSRLTLWGFALEVWKSAPLCGVGAWQYRPTLEALPIAQLFPPDLVHLSHPHNVYLQVLCETGIVGFLLCFGSLFFLVGKAGAGIAHFSKKTHLSGQQKELLHYARYFLLACLAFFVHGLVGHDFFRPWYQSLFFCHLGILSGCVSSLWREERAGQDHWQEKRSPHNRVHAGVADGSASVS